MANKHMKLQPHSKGTECQHVASLPVEGVIPSKLYTEGCEDCLQMIANGTKTYWVHLRVCMSCGHVGCCDSSPNTHATKHFKGVGHPIVKSYEPGETWDWCYVEKTGATKRSGI